METDKECVCCKEIMQVKQYDNLIGWILEEMKFPFPGS